jgi:beta-mannosidase
MAACTSAVDYYARPKPAYYAVRRAYAPLLISARFDTLAWGDCEQFEAQAWVGNSHDRSYSDVTLQMRLVGMKGKTYSESVETFSIGANRAGKLDALQHPIDQIPEDVFFLDLQLLDMDGARLAHNRYAFSRTTTLAPLFACPPAKLSVSSRTGENRQILTLTNPGKTAAMFVWLEEDRDVKSSGYAYFDDNYFCLLPGEVRTVTVTWKDVPASEQRIEISGWNTETLRLKLSAQEEV